MRFVVVMVCVGLVKRIAIVEMIHRSVVLVSAKKSLMLAPKIVIAWGQGVA